MMKNIKCDNVKLNVVISYGFDIAANKNKTWICRKKAKSKSVKKKHEMQAKNWKYVREKLNVDIKYGFDIAGNENETKIRRRKNNK